MVSRAAHETQAVRVTRAPNQHAQRRFRRDSLRRRMLALGDGMAIAATAVAVWASGAPAGTAAAVVLFIPGWLLVAKVCGLYDRDHRSIRCLTIDELGRIVGVALAGTTVLAAGLFVLGFNELSASVELRLWVLLAASIFLFRVAARACWRRVTPPERALILGEGPLVDATRRKLELFPDIHVEAIAIRGTEDFHADDAYLDDVDRVIVASQTLDERLLAEAIEVARERQLKLSVVPPVRGMLGTAVQLSHVADMPFIEYYTWDTSRTTLLGKRILDLTVALIGLVLLSPLLIAIAIRDPRLERRPRLLRAVAGGSRRQALPDVQIPDDGGRRR